MVRYFYAWTPLVIVGTIFFLALPWLALIALLIVALFALAALAAAVVFLPFMLGRAIVRNRHSVSAARPRTAPAPGAGQAPERLARACA
jgi:uncharacterized membrane protein